MEEMALKVGLKKAEDRILVPFEDVPKQQRPVDPQDIYDLFFQRLSPAVPQESRCLAEPLAADPL